MLHLLCALLLLSQLRWLRQLRLLLLLLPTPLRHLLLCLCWLLMLLLFCCWFTCASISNLARQLLTTSIFSRSCQLCCCYGLLGAGSTALHCTSVCNSILLGCSISLCWR
jgi:hypothetical protein